MSRVGSLRWLMSPMFLLRTWVVLLPLLACTLHFAVLCIGFVSYESDITLYYMSDIRLYYLTFSVGFLKLVTIYIESQNYMEVYLFLKFSLTIVYIIFTTIVAIICMAGVNIVFECNLWRTFICSSIILLVDGLLSIVQFLQFVEFGRRLDAAIQQKPSSTTPVVVSKLPNVSWFILGRVPWRTKKIPKDDKLD